jgi:predicted transcriptional regulator
MNTTQKQTKTTKNAAKRTTSAAKKQTAKAAASRVARTSKKDTVMALLRRADGATAPEIMEATGWQRHSVRGFLSILGKTLKIERNKEGRYSAK